jgi:hypothetical protein
MDLWAVTPVNPFLFYPSSCLPQKTIFLIKTNAEQTGQVMMACENFWLNYKLIYDTSSSIKSGSCLALCESLILYIS